MVNYTEPKTDDINYCGVGFKFQPDNQIFDDIDSVNEIIYNSES